MERGADLVVGTYVLVLRVQFYGFRFPCDTVESAPQNTLEKGGALSGVGD